jgi:hypothetical protein
MSSVVASSYIFNTFRYPERTITARFSGTDIPVCPFRLKGESKSRQTRMSVLLRKGAYELVDFCLRIVEMRRNPQPVSSGRGDNVSFLEVGVQTH